MTAIVANVLHCWLCAWQLTETSAIRANRDGRKPTCSDCARIRYGPAPPRNTQPKSKRPDHDEIARRILEAIGDVMNDVPTDTRQFLEVLVRRAPTILSARQFAAAFGMHPSSVQSRLSRAGLPSLKDYLAMVRLVYAARYFEDGAATCGLVAYRLEYSSPQSFNRHVKARLGVHASEVRGIGYEGMLQRFVTTLIEPYRGQLIHFNPSPRRLPSIGET
jgi:AraC-like DNA-binding protein